MNPDDRRAAEPGASEGFCDEYLAVLVVCGGTVRESDWRRLPASIAARRRGPRADAADDTDVALLPRPT